MKKVKSKFKSFDLFGQSVNFTWKGSDQYKTMLGATVSIAIIIIMIAYTVSRCNAMVNRINPTVSKITLIRPSTDEKSFRPQEGTFDFAFTLSKELEPKYGFITVYNI